MALLDRYVLRFGPIGEQPTDLLRIAGVNYSEAHLGAGSADVRFPIAQAVDAVGTSLVTRENFRPRRSWIWIERDRVVVWSGMLESVNTSPETGEMTATAKGPLEYFRRRYFHTDKTWTTIDQLTIAREMIDHAQAVSGGSIGVKTTDTNTSGVTRARTFLGRERKNYGEALEQLAGVVNGFDFRFDSFLNPASDDYEIEFRTSYPATGRTTALVFEHGVNCAITETDEDGSAGANYITSTGAGEKTAMLIATCFDAAALLVEPLLERTLGRPDVTIQATLLEHCERELERRLDDAIFVRVRMYPGATPGIGSYLMGDRVRLIYSDAYQSLDRTMRIASRAVEVVGGAEEVEVVLGPVDAVLAPDVGRSERELLRRVETLERARRATI